MILELRVYTLKGGTRAEFQRRAEQQIVPMLERHGIKVLAARPSLHDENSFCLLRAYSTIDERESQLAGFYGSEEWLTEHDAAVMALIETYSTCVIQAEEVVVEALS